MNHKFISIDITPNSDSMFSANGGVMWEHNATSLKFTVAPELVGEYRYYIEYRSLMGTKVRTEYLELNTEDNTVTYDIPVSMSSLKGVECYFNVVSIDEDGNTVQIIKPKKFCLTFDYSPDTDNSLCKVNDFSINSLLEAIRLGTFKGDTGERGEKGEKGDKGDTGGISEEYATKNFANAVKGCAAGLTVVVNDVSPVEHTINVKINQDEGITVDPTNVTLTVCGKNLFNGELMKGYYKNTDFEMESLTSSIFYSCQRFYPKGTYTVSFNEDVNIIRRVYLDKFLQAGITNTKSFSFTLEEDCVYGFSFRRADNTAWDTTSPIQIELGDTATEYERYKGVDYVPNSDGVVAGVKSISPLMTLLTDTKGAVINVEYNKDINKVIEKIITAVNSLGGTI